VAYGDVSDQEAKNVLPNPMPGGEDRGGATQGWSAQKTRLLVPDIQDAAVAASSNSARLPGYNQGPE